MDRTQIIDAVYDACEEVLKVDRSTLSETTSFADDLDADSLALVEVVMQLEETFDLTIPEDELEGVGTIGGAADVVAKHIEAAA
ncbi:acyl carrier protein [Aquihabitans sp. G128]|uniref:acyl carrier protein n=1 Tax=Aquihabitans sp. G128 TaxID=2849779 RepID=UPI001C246140|nr:acyl carrier protein [Aquihabitans sp. G128]QXC61464.1 acyl carrier protein [Aquihabitans sp. G128]